jgi:hypothetical protein
MGKKYWTLIILIAFAVLLNCVVLGVLVSQPSTQNGVNSPYIDKPISKVTASVIPAYLLPSVTSIPSPMSTNTNISSSSPNTEKLKITYVQTNLTGGSFLVLISNDDTSPVVVTTVLVNGCSANLEKDVTIPANSSIELLLTIADGITFAQTYQIRLQSSEGQSAVFYEIVC